MRIISTSAGALAVVCMAASVSADGRRPLVVVSAEVSATGSTLFVTGSHFGQAPEVKLGGRVLGGVVVTASGTQLTANLPAFPPGSYLLEVSRHYSSLWQRDDNNDVARLTVAIGAMGPKGEDGSKGDTGDVGPQGEKGDKGDPGAPGMPGNLALEGQICPPGVPLRGFSASGSLVCGLTEPSTCGNGVLDNGEEFDSAPAGFGPGLVNTNTCRFDFSQVHQLFCNRTCSVVGPTGCDQADADLLCKLKTGNPNSTATSFAIELALREGGFSCPGLGTRVQNVNDRGIQVPVYYSPTDLLDSHGDGNSVTNVVCTNP